MATTPEEAVQAQPGDGVIGWTLDREQRRDLLEQFPPKYETVVADHVTLKAGVAADARLPQPTTGAILGRADDGRGVECMVVAIGGSTARPGQGTYHVTWSLAAGRRARESNDLLAQGRWDRLDSPVAIRLTPARLR